MKVTIEDDAKEFELIVGHLIIENIENKRNRNSRMDKLISELQKEVRENSNKFLDMHELKCYKNFIDATKSVIESKEPGPAILANLILKNGYLPTISRAVDCMNVVSIKTGLTFSMWNKDLIKGDVVYKLSKCGEKYWPFMGDEVELLEGELIAVDGEKVLCLVRYRDSNYDPVTLETKNITIHIQGINGINEDKIKNALDEIERLLLENVSGQTKEKNIITSV